jgi:hypothetical protein
MFFNQIMHSFWRILKRCLKQDYEGTLEELDKVDIIDPNGAFILNSHGYVKNILREYQWFFKVDILEPNNAFILNNCGNVKKMLKDYQGALGHLDKVDVLE